MKSWKTTIIGLGIAVIGVLQGTHDGSLLDALKDPNVQLAVAGAVLGFLAKDAGVNAKNEFKEEETEQIESQTKPEDKSNKTNNN